MSLLDSIDTDFSMTVDLLSAVLAELSAGNDVAPAQLFAIEASLTHAIAKGMAVDEVRKRVDKLLPANCSLSFIDGGKKVVLQLWQQRAPVVPTT
jgi:hypothetical protein